MADKNARKKRKLGSYPFGSVIFSITLAIFVMGLFGLLFVYTQSLTKAIQKNVEIQVFFKKQVTQSDIDFVTRAVSESNYVRLEESYPQVKFISKEDAAKQFIEDTGEDFTEFIGDNPLRDALVVSINPDYQKTDSLRVIQASLEKNRAVYEVTFVESLVESINKNLTKIGLILGGFSLILMLVVVILINNTIKLALFSQRFLIRSMQLVGATGRFIRRPFLIRAAFYGLLAGVIASGLIYGLMLYANSQIENLQDLQDINSLLILCLSLVILGIIVGYLSTYRAVRKYLKLSLDELY
jgi:cell division transport system permease protein